MVSGEACLDAWQSKEALVMEKDKVEGGQCGQVVGTR